MGNFEDRINMADLEQVSERNRFKLDIGCNNVKMFKLHRFK